MKYIPKPRTTMKATITTDTKEYQEEVLNWLEAIQKHPQAIKIIIEWVKSKIELIRTNEGNFISKII